MTLEEVRARAKERALMAYAMKRDGMTLREIAAQIPQIDGTGQISKQMAHVLVKRAELRYGMPALDTAAKKR